MKILIYAAIVMCSVFGTTEVAVAQSDLDQIEQKLTRHIEKILPGWKHKRGEPIVKSENVLIQFWYSTEKSVKISVVPHRSGGEAKEALREFIKYERDREALDGLGDEAYAWGFAGADIVFRKGRLVVYMNTKADVGAAPDERTLSQDERLEREKNEMRKWSREFAKHAAKALDDQ